MSHPQLLVVPKSVVNSSKSFWIHGTKTVNLKICLYNVYNKHTEKKTQQNQIKKFHLLEESSGVSG